MRSSSNAGDVRILPVGSLAAGRGAAACQAERAAAAAPAALRSTGDRSFQARVCSVPDALTAAAFAGSTRKDASARKAPCLAGALRGYGTFVVEGSIEVVASRVVPRGVLYQVASPRVPSPRKARQSDKHFGFGG